MMRHHAKRIAAHPDAEIVGLCDVSEAVTRAFAAENLLVSPAPAHFTDPSAMLDKLRPDAVFIGTPHTQHFEHGMLALRAGCHVFMEKPMVTSFDDAYAIENAARQSGKIFVIGYNTPCSPAFNYLRDTIRSASLGKLELVSGFLSQNWMNGTRGSWRQDPALSGGGQAYDSGAHLLNSLCWSVEQEVEEVFAFVDNHGTPVDINSVASIRFANGVLANITVSGNSPGSGSFMVFIFEKGRIEIDGWNAEWIRVREGSEEISNPSIGPELGASSPDENFIDAILGRAEAKTGPRNGVIHAQLMEAIYESQRTGMPARPNRMKLAS
jgi:predicted dehydrogenase